MVEDRATAQQDLTPRAVGGQDYPRSVGEKVKLRTAKSPAPWLRVVK
jgi:alkylated DNA nucleotide flippase Atl1